MPRIHSNVGFGWGAQTFSGGTWAFLSSPLVTGWRQSDKAVSYGIVFTLFVCLCAHLCADIYGTVTDGGLAPISHIYLSLEERSMNWTWMSIYYQIISRIWGEGPHHHHITATGCLCMCLCLSASVYVCLSVSVRLKVIRRKRGIQAHLSVCLSVCLCQSINQSISLLVIFVSGHKTDDDDDDDNDNNAIESTSGVDVVAHMCGQKADTSSN